MKTEMRRALVWLVVCSLWLAACGAGSAYAATEGDGTLDQSAAPSESGGRMYSLKAIYDRLHEGTPAVKGSGFTEPAAAPANGVMYTLNNILDGGTVSGTPFPGFDTDVTTINVTPATSADVLSTKKFFATTGTTRDTDWGPVTGTMVNNGAGATITPTTSDQTIAAGFWSSANTVSGDADLAAGNIKKDTAIFAVTGTFASGGGLLKTGQTTSYVTGDDGNLQKGIAKSYTLGTGINTGTVFDNITGLQWELKTDDGSIHDKDNTYAWKTAEGTYPAFQTFIATLNTSLFAGKDDWRLPNIYELYSLTLLSAGNGAPYINKTVFATAPYYTVSGHYWSSTTCPNSTGYALLVYFSTGYVLNGDKTSTDYVRAVRGGQ